MVLHPGQPTLRQAWPARAGVFAALASAAAAVTTGTAIRRRGMHLWLMGWAAVRFLFTHSRMTGRLAVWVLPAWPHRKGHLEVMGTSACPLKMLSTRGHDCMTLLLL